MTPDVNTEGPHAMSHTDQSVITMAIEGSQDSRQSQSQSAGRFALESDHLALKNNSEYVVVYGNYSYCIMARLVKCSLPCVTNY